MSVFLTLRRVMVASVVMAGVPFTSGAGTIEDYADSVKNLRYAVFCLENPRSISEFVDIRIQEGWSPQGGVTVYKFIDNPGSDKDYYQVCQAMVK